MSAELTPYQSQYIAWRLSRRMETDSIDMLAGTLVDVRIIIDPSGGTARW